MDTTRVKSLLRAAISLSVLLLLITPCLGETQTVSGETVAPTTTAPTPKPAVGGGGGGGGVLPAPKAFTTRYIEAEAEEEKRFEVPYDSFLDTNVVAIIFKPEENTDVRFKVEKLKGLPASIPAPERALLFLKIDMDMSRETKLSGAIEFAVERAAIAEKGFDPDKAEVVLMRYVEGWEELKTEFLRSDEKYNYYRAEIESFSIFAAAVKSVVTPTTPPVTETTTTPTATTTATPAAPPGAWTWIPAIIAIVLVIAIIVALRRAGR